MDHHQAKEYHSQYQQRRFATPTFQDPPRGSPSEILKQAPFGVLYNLRNFGHPMTSLAHQSYGPEPKKAHFMSIYINLRGS